MKTSKLKGFFIFSFLVCINISYAQQDSIRTNDNEQSPLSLEDAASKMIASIADKDYDTYMDMIYPEIVEVFGGREMMMKSTKTNKEAQETAGMVLKSARLAEISEVAEKDGHFQAIVSFEYILEISGNDYKGEQYLWAISDKKDLVWSFVELETFDKTSILEFLPNFNQDLTFPTIKGAEYIEK